MLKTLFGFHGHAARTRSEHKGRTGAATKILDEESAVFEPARFKATVDETLSFLRRVLASGVRPTDKYELAHSLLLQRTRLRKLPGNLVVNGDLRLDGCQRFGGFTGNELTVKGDLFIGGPSLNPYWIGDGEQPNEHGQRVAEFLTRPSVESQSPFAKWPRKVTVEGDVVLVNCRQLTVLPEEFSFGGDIRIINCGLENLPEGLVVHGKLTLDNCSIDRLPNKLAVQQLELRNLAIRELPSDLKTGGLVIKCCPEIKTIGTTRPYDSLVVQRCGLEELPVESCRAKSIVVRDCPFAVLEIPSECWRLNISNCAKLRELRSANTKVNLGWLQISDCPELSRLPSGLSLRGLRLSNLVALKRIPKDLSCRTAIELGGTELEAVEPEQMRSLRFRYLGVPVSAHAFFEPEKITIDEILSSRNAEVRRMMLQQMGVERFVGQTEKWMVDQDSDPGGKRLLIRFHPFGPTVAYLMCSCPSTARVYLMQVPNSVQTCREAAAWLAGFDNPDDYQPLIET